MMASSKPIRKDNSLFKDLDRPSDKKFFVRIDELALDFRGNNVLHGLGIEFVGQLVLQNEQNLLRIENCGRKTVKIIENSLKKFDLELGLDEPEWGVLDAQEIESDFRREVVAAASWLARKKRPADLSYLEDELEQLLVDIKDPRNCEIFVRRIGLNGNDPETLQKIATDIGGLTRERIRQITDKIIMRISKKSWHMPILDKAISSIFSLVPCSEKKVSEALRELGICRGNYSVRGIVAVSKILRKNLPIEKCGPKHPDLWVPQEHKNVVKNVISLAKKTMSASGLATFDSLADEIEKNEGIKISSDFVHELVKKEPQFRILDSDRGWFWFETTRNRLVNTLRKIFSVTECAHVSEVRLAIQRFRKLEGFAPPQRVLISFCKCLPELEVKDTFIHRAQGVSTEGWITGAELMFAKILKKHGGVLDRIKLGEECLKEGMNEHTFNIYLHISPLLLKLGRGVFGLIGANATAGQIAAMELNKSKFKAVSNYEWCSNGDLRINYRVTDNMLYTGFFPVPGPICEYFEGPFVLVNDDGEELGRIKTKREVAWSLKKLFRATGGEEGDPFSLTFNLTEKKVVIDFDNSVDD